MTRLELLALIAVAITMITTGLVWLFGAIPLIAVGAVLLVTAFFINAEGV